MEKKILVVEDSKITRELIVSTLEDMDELSEYEMVEAENGFQALKLLPRNKFSLIITDINMPDINGLELVKFIKGNQLYKEIPLIIISTEGSKRDREKGLALGADSYLVKPFDPEALRKLVKKYLQEKEYG